MYFGHEETLVEGGAVVLVLQERLNVTTGQILLHNEEGPWLRARAHEEADIWMLERATKRSVQVYFVGDAERAQGLTGSNAHTTPQKRSGTQKRRK